MICTGPITYKGHAQLKRDIANLKAALQGAHGREAFMPAISPVEHRGLAKKRLLQDTGGICFRHRRRDARGIQGDRRCRLPPADRRPAARLLLHSASQRQHRRVPQMGEAAGRRRSITRCAAYRRRRSATTPVTASTWVRACTTWRSRISLDIILKISAGAYSFEAANPRHEHEWKVWGTPSFRRTRC